MKTLKDFIDLYNIPKILQIEVKKIIGNYHKAYIESSLKHSYLFYQGNKREIKNAPVKDEGNLMFSQRNNPYCDLLRISSANVYIFFGK